MHGIPIKFQGFKNDGMIKYEAERAFKNVRQGIKCNLGNQ